MDNEIGHAEWKQGKISGAVYRTHNRLTLARVASLIVFELRRRWRRSDEGHCRRVRALRGLQPTASGCFPSSPEDGGRNRSNVPSDVQQPYRCRRDYLRWHRVYHHVSEDASRLGKSHEGHHGAGDVCWKRSYSALFLLILCRIIPISAHAAFDKAAAYFNIKVHTLPVNMKTRQVDLARVARAMCVHS